MKNKEYISIKKMIEYIDKALRYTKTVVLNNIWDIVREDIVKLKNEINTI